MPEDGARAPLTPESDRSLVVVTGAGGLIGGILLPHLARRFRVRAVDIRPVPAVSGVDPTRGSVTDARLLGEMFAGCRYVIHLATGSARGWEGLLDVDVDGTRIVFEQAAEAGVHRIVFASTNHVAGGLELDVLGGRRSAGGPIAVVRPDSPYGAAKAFGEAYGRFIAEATGTAVSCLRIGSVRSTAELDDYDVSAELLPPEVAEYMPSEHRTPVALHARLRRAWLSHGDLIEIVDEELAATDQFRLRWAVSDSPERVWPLDPYTWDGGRP